MVQYTGFDWKSEEMKWISKPVIPRRDWLQDYPGSQFIKHPALIMEVPLYKRELGRTGCREDYMKTKTFTPKLDEDQYYYRDNFYENRAYKFFLVVWLNLLLGHWNFVSRKIEESRVSSRVGNNTSPAASLPKNEVVIISIEKWDKTNPMKQEPPEASSSKTFLKVLIQSEEGSERITLPLKGTSFDKDYPVLEVKKRVSRLNNLRFDRLKGPSVKEVVLAHEASVIVDPHLYNFGILYSKGHQKTENEMYCNETGSEAFEEFLEFLGKRVRLQGWPNFAGGLDVESR